MICIDRSLLCADKSPQLYQHTECLISTSRFARLCLFCSRAYQQKVRARYELHMVHANGAASYCNTLQRVATHCCRREILNWRRMWYMPMCCITLQLIATNCNSLQHIATQCNTQEILNWRRMWYTPIVLHHTATYCNSLQLIATHCNPLQHTGNFETATDLVHADGAASHCNTL